MKPFGKIDAYKVMIEAANRYYKEYEETKEAAEKFFIEHKLWRPLNELNSYLKEGDWKAPPFTIFYTFVNGEYKDRVGSFYIYGDIVEFQDDKLYYSDYNDGIIVWNEEDNCYDWHYLHEVTQINILGWREE